ncbi:MAG: phospho-N-acetylmuramoyl-pentapeptide-transferase [Verrucomicrobia bacterium]|nr:phospho-N-acetylmuramoyl-pentapeptide-transferase [Verrucomicrobiota bacterium]
MFYFLHHLTRFSDALGPLNIFRYVNFRALMAAVTAMLVSVWLGPRLIAWLGRQKNGEQVGGDASLAKLAELRKGKGATPSRGGILIVTALAISTLLWANPSVRFIWLTLFCLLWLAALGWLDDTMKVRKKERQGLGGWQKLTGQVALGLVVGAWLWLDLDTSKQVRELWLPFWKKPVIADIGLWAILWIELIVIASSNAVNLTDGMDGLAIGCTISAAAALGVLAYVADQPKLAAYLHIPHLKDAGELTVFCAALFGAGIGFLWFNCHPAQVFMGDTGSLAIGGVLGVVAVVIQQPFTLLLIGGIFVVEAASVIIQVSYFKWTKSRYGEGRRVFLMTPLHHHFQLKGWSETQVVVRFWILALLFALVGLGTLKLR